MKISIYRHDGGYCFVPETIDAGRVLKAEEARGLFYAETSMRELVESGFASTAHMILTRMYVNLPLDVAEDLLDKLGKTGSNVKTDANAMAVSL